MTDIIDYARTKPVTLWTGISPLTGETVRAVGSWTDNRKTGRAYGISFYSGSDGAGCNRCQVKSACYVKSVFYDIGAHDKRITQGHPVLPRSKWSQVFGDSFVRLGVYGDPGTVPARVLREIIKPAKSWAGYTHLWREIPTGDYSPFLMASVEDLEGQKHAERLGYRWYYSPRVGSPRDYITKRKRVIRTLWARIRDISGAGRTICPNYVTAGRIQCRDCAAGCRGTSGNFDISNPAHGPRSGSYPSDHLPIVD